jgi:Ring finger domain
MNFSSSITFVPGNGMVIRNGNQVIQMGSNGMTISNSGGQQVVMGSSGMQIYNPSTNIRYNSNGYSSNININTNYSYGQDNWDSDEYDEEDQSNYSDSFEDGNTYTNSYQTSYSMNYQISNNGQVTYSQSYQAPTQTYSYSNNYNNYQMQQQPQQEEPPRRQGLTKAEINQLPLSVYTVKKPSTGTKKSVLLPGGKNSTTKSSTKSNTSSNTSEASSNNACAICIGDYKHGEKLRTLPCMHKYHMECVDKWLVKKSECPMCKYDLLEG